MGTWPTTATVAECSNSETPGPANVAPNKRVVIEVDDHAGLAGVTVGVKLCASHRFPDFDVYDLNSVAGLLGLMGGQADRGGLGSVKNTCGTAW